MPVSDLVTLATLAAGCLALVHLRGSWLLAKFDSPEWVLSGAGGAAVAYVFVDALPSLRLVGERLAVQDHRLVTVTGDVFLLALLGFASYYALEHVVESHLVGETWCTTEDTSQFAVHLGGFLVYDVLIGYLLVYPAVLDHHLGAFAVAMGLHLLGTDYDLRVHDEALFHRFGRWFLALGVLAGTALGHLVSFGELGPGMVYAFLVGGILLNVVKTELPAAAESRLPAFLAGAGGYTALLLALT